MVLCVPQTPYEWLVEEYDIEKIEDKKQTIEGIKLNVIIALEKYERVKLTRHCRRPLFTMLFVTFLNFEIIVFTIILFTN